MTRYLGPNPMVAELMGDIGALLVGGVLDEILVLIAPVMLGDGVRLFGYPGGSAVALERISLSQAQGRAA